MKFFNKFNLVKSFLATALFCCTVFFNNTKAQTVVDSGTCGANLTWTLTSDSVLTIRGSGAMTDYWYSIPWYSYTGQDTNATIIIKEVIIEDSVTSIGNYAFYGCTGLTNVTIGNSVTTIGSSAFYYCTGLTSINVDTNNTYYSSEDGILYNKLQNTLILCPQGKAGVVIVPNSVTTIGSSAFYYCTGLTSINIPNSVTTIGQSAFSSCSGLTSITIPNSVTAIGSSAFSGCSNLNYIYVDTNNNYYSSDNYGILYNKSQDTLLLCPQGKAGAVIIPNSVTTIKGGSFNCPNLTTLTIGNAVTTIENYAIVLKSLSMIIFNADSCTNVVYGSIDTGNIVTIQIGSNVKCIPRYMFYNCNRIKQIISNAITPPTIDLYTFINWSLASISLYVPCGADSLYMADSLWNRFNIIAASVDTVIFDTICMGQTYNANGFYADTTGVHIQSIDSCTIKILNLYVQSKYEVVNGDGKTIWYNITSDTTVEVTFKGSTYYQWGNEYSGDVVIPSTVTLPCGTYKVTSIAAYTFYNCIWLTSITIPEFITTMGSSAFNSCTGLTSVIWNATNCTSGNVFGNTSITNVTFGDNVLTIPNSAFYGCIGLTSISIPNSVVSIGNRAFYYCTSLTTLNYNAVNCASVGSTTIPHWLQGCSSLSTINIGDSVLTIPDYAFYGCSGLDTIYSNAIVPPTASSNSFYDVPTNIPVYIPCMTSQNYILANYWSNFTNYRINGPITPDTTFYTDTICAGTTYTDNNFSNLSQAGTYYTTLANANGCDSVVAIRLNFYPAVSMGYYSATFCYGGSYSDSNFTNLTQGGYHYDTLQNANGCDSVVRLYLSVDTAVIRYNYSASICYGGSYSDNNFTNLTQAGYYYDTLKTPDGCDSIVRLYLSVRPIIVHNYSATFCYGGSYSDSNFTNLTQEGYYSDTLQTPDGCDSIVALSLSVHIPSPTYLNASMCRGGIYSDSNFTNITESGTYYDTLQDIYGCDSVLILYVSYYPTVAMTYHSATICHGNIYSDSNFINLTESGTYYDTLQNINGCDSIIRLTLYASYISTPYYYASICNGDSYSDSNFSNLTQEGYYSDTLQTPDGCDSIVRLRLTYKQSPTQALCMISVEENNHNQIVWKNNEIISAYKIYREGTQSGIYDCIATVDYDSNNVWIDTASNATERSYRYKISGIDTCGNESDLSAFHKTMHLTINQGVGSSWNLIWTPYEGITYPTLNIYRSSGVQMGNLELIQTISGNNTSYTDNNAPSGYVYYQIEIVLDEPCTTRKSFASIRSNIATNAPNTNSINEFRTSEIQLYPNPTSSQLKIKNYQIKDGENVEIIDVLGRVQKSTIINQQSEIIIDVSHLAKGMYFIKIGNWRGKFVVN